MLSNKVILNQSSTNEVFDLISVESLLTLELGLNRLFEIFISYDLPFTLRVYSPSTFILSVLLTICL